MAVTIRAMRPEDYDNVRALWESIHGFAIRSIDDSREGILRFLSRNPGISAVAVETEDYPDGEAVQAEASGETIVGSILCGHDGRTGTFYHVCVAEEHRRRGIGKEMVVFCMRGLMEEKINTISLVAFLDNEAGNGFWNGIGWTMRSDLNQYEFKLNTENIIAYMK